jgi:hypothetical protein
MQDSKISALLSLAMISSPFAISAGVPTKENSAINSTKTLSPRSSARRMNHELTPAPLLKPMGTYVGELQEQWQFPSDHLPIGMTFEDLNFVSWNVLDNESMDWVIEKNSQGLSRSQIAEEHVFIGESGLTIRDQHVVDLILGMISHPTYPRNVLALQETNSTFIDELRSRLPAQFEVLVCYGEAIVFDRSQLEVVEEKKVAGIFADAPYRNVQDVTFRKLNNDQIIRIVNSHLPGDPTKPGRFEFAQYLAKTFDRSITTMAMGDMNFNEIEMSDALQQAFPQGGPFLLLSPYCTNISPNTFESKSIDHFMVYSPDEAAVQLNAASEILPGLEKIVSLLDGNKN